MRDTPAAYSVASTVDGPRKSVTVKPIIYHGATDGLQRARQDFVAARAIYRQAGIDLKWGDPIIVGQQGTIQDLGNDMTLQLPGQTGYSSEAQNIVGRAGGVLDGQAIAAYIGDIEISSIGGVAGYYTKGSGIVAIDNSSMRLHNLAHEIGHYYGLSHPEIPPPGNLMHGDSNRMVGLKHLSTSQIDTVRSLSPTQMSLGGRIMRWWDSW